VLEPSARRVKAVMARSSIWFRILFRTAIGLLLKESLAGPGNRDTFAFRCR